MSIRKLQAMKAKKGFTLVELIVVIAIIAILAAILIPLLVNHVRNSRCTQEFADATSGHNMIAERISDAFSRGIAPAEIWDGNSAVPMPTGAAGWNTFFDGEQGWDELDEAEVDFEADNIQGFSIVTQKGDHVYPSSESEGDCGNRNCPVGQNEAD